jgi:hypothetical protein
VEWSNRDRIVGYRFREATYRKSCLNEKAGQSACGQYLNCSRINGKTLCNISFDPRTGLPTGKISL